jgi:acyl-CoA synthetase (AMP-forming)/AMP-acid ligase II
MPHVVLAAAAASRLRSSRPDPPALDRSGRTGDFGRIDGNVLYLESRMRDLIIRGGENVYPIEIENRLVEHPDIDQAYVVVDHQILGQ